MKKVAPPATLPSLVSNGFATKDDIKRLKESINERFDRFEHRFEWFKDDWEWWKKDTFRLFEHRWQQLIDPVLKEIVDMRESYEIEMGRSAENRDRIDAIDGKVEKLDGRMGMMGKRMAKMETMFGGIKIVLGKIAKKVGA